MELEIRNFKKSFNENTIWTNLCTTMKSGEIISIHGKSGEGKTTFLRCLNGLEPLEKGQVFFDGEEVDLTTMGGDERPFGMVFQGFNLFPQMTVWENIVLAPKYHKQKEEEIQERALALLDQLELTEHKNKKPHQLSGGQKQRVAIARACMLQPKVLCFDEPTSALDEETSERFVSILKDLSRTGMIQIIVTHDKPFALEVSDRILHIREGVFFEDK
ncbi:ATP-binding cassette domain-containing protein [Peptoniphilus sp. KCTC 25270]|uniref:amino acid ABC transporter ATP-binding protein n=1 Tax=Peptoniphilus sp. KCTC 25270 TaxID=2897414 RepID=UPI001E2E5EF0|nr:ATP-binding cassette domain-containing protein [Peptoniphilus sp. KCTC 25270]MCD1147717.1 ATP-binding cassette domain-containing protein [Peptoniphilus sp. KCTC 25270]